MSLVLLKIEQNIQEFDLANRTAMGIAYCLLKR